MDERQWWYGASAINAPQPWSGYYEVTSTLWAFAHTTQFTQPGWLYLQLGAGSGNLTGGGTYVSLTDPSRSHLTIVIEKVAYAASTCEHNGLPYATSDEVANFTLGGSFAGLDKVEAWYTHYGDGSPSQPTGEWREIDITEYHPGLHCLHTTCSPEPAVVFEHVPSIPVINGTISVVVRVGDVWTLSTISNASKAVVPSSPPRAAFPAPYATDFEDVTPPRAPPLWTDQGGAFEAWASGDPTHGITLRQSVPTHPISWGRAPQETSDGITPHTIFGDGRWTDFNISAAFVIEPGSGADPATGTPGAMLGARASGNINRMNGVWFAVDAFGAWNVSLSSGTIALPGVQLASGPCAVVQPGTWHTMALNVSAGFATGSLDGELLFSELDVTANGTSSRAGWAALGTTDFGYVQFDDVAVNGLDAGATMGCDPSKAMPLASPTNVSVWRCDDAAASGSFDWLAAPGVNASLYGPAGQLVLRGGSGPELCLANTITSPEGWPLVQLVTCEVSASPDISQLWVVRADNQIMSPKPWDPPGSFPCLSMGGDAWSFGPATFAQQRNCGPLSSILFNWDAVSGQIWSEWLPELCLAACASSPAASRGTNRHTSRL